MEIHIQKCQQCKSRNLRNILVRDEKQKVFVQCRDCDALVARYILTPGGYFHAGKGFESFLRSIERDGGLTSARNVDEQFHQAEDGTVEEFAELQQPLKEKYQGGLP
ncbi:hypothetical protein [Agaribacterium haliotis]|uniref:hypothetical protein n=1 Tax=Agaribacterium haliotis TaxID=2013869 RepID=UPI001EFD08E0|nr:hypothetical protein [Agaribacterium haliotis]